MIHTGLLHECFFIEKSVPELLLFRLLNNNSVVSEKLVELILSVLLSAFLISSFSRGVVVPIPTFCALTILIKKKKGENNSGFITGRFDVYES